MLLNFNKIAFIVFAVFLQGCNGGVPPFEMVDIDPKVVLQFSLMNGDEEIDIQDEFTDAEGNVLKLRTLRFYISDVSLEDASGNTASLSEVELIDFNDGTSTSTFKQNATFIIPDETYEKLVFSVGLPADVNSQSPSETSSDPLSLYTDMYWDWGSMYSFIKIQASIDTNFDQSFDGDIAFHTGLDTMFRPERTYPMSFTIDPFEKDTIMIDIDWNTLFNRNTETDIDLSLVPFYHAHIGEANSDAVRLNRYFTDNFVNSISLRSAQ